MKLLAPMAVLAALLTASCSAPPPAGPRLEERTRLGYQCRTHDDCRDGTKCYVRNPTFAGRCVLRDFWAKHSRTCRSDAECEASEVCRRKTMALFGTCHPMFRDQPK